MNLSFTANVLLGLILTHAISTDAIAQSPTPWENNLQVLRDSGINPTGSGSSQIGSGNNSLSGGSSFSSFPPLNPRRESLGSTKGAANVSVGCDGINLSTILSSRLDEYQKVIEGLVDEAPSFLILWMAYSQPTLASILDQLNIEFGAGLDLATFSCANAKRFAEENPFDYGDTFGKEGCIGENGGNSSDCVGNNTKHTEEAMSNKIADIKQKISPALQKLKSSTKKFGITTTGLGGSGNKNLPLSPQPVNTDCYEELESSNSSMNFTDLVLLMGQVDCYQHDTYSGLLPVFEVNENDLQGGLIATQRNESINNIYHSKAHEYYALIHSVVLNTAVIVDNDGKNPQTAKIGENNGVILAANGTESKAIIEAKTRMIFEPYIIELLQKAIGDNDSDKYTRARSQLASQFSYTEVALGVNSIKTSALNGIALMQQQPDLPQNAAIELTNVVQNLTNELDEVEMLKNISSEIIDSQLKILNN